MQEDETYHLLLDADLERRLVEAGSILSAPADTGFHPQPNEPPAEPRLGYRLVVPCTSGS